jgi:hypothetical protein
MHASGSQRRKVGALHDGGALRPVIDSGFPFEQTLGAMS